jgi:hypothetical protein
MSKDVLVHIDGTIAAVSHATGERYSGDAGKLLENKKVRTGHRHFNRKSFMARFKIAREVFKQLKGLL